MLSTSKTATSNFLIGTPLSPSQRLSPDYVAFPKLLDFSLTPRKSATSQFLIDNLNGITAPPFTLSAVEGSHSSSAAACGSPTHPSSPRLPSTSRDRYRVLRANCRSGGKGFSRVGRLRLRPRPLRHLSPLGMETCDRAGLPLEVLLSHGRGKRQNLRNPSSRLAQEQALRQSSVLPAIFQRSRPHRRFIRSRGSAAGGGNPHRPRRESGVYRASPPRRFPCILAGENSQSDARVRRLSGCGRKYAAFVHENENQHPPLAQAGAPGRIRPGRIPGKFLRCFLSQDARARHSGVQPQILRDDSRKFPGRIIHLPRSPRREDCRCRILDGLARFDRGKLERLLAQGIESSPQYVPVLADALFCWTERLSHFQFRPLFRRLWHLRIQAAMEHARRPAELELLECCWRTGVGVESG